MELAKPAFPALPQAKEDSEVRAAWAPPPGGAGRGERGGPRGVRGAPCGRSPPSSRPLPAGPARLGSALPAPFLRSSKGFLHPALPAGLGGRRWEAPCPCPARDPLMGDPSQSTDSPHNPQCPLTTVPRVPHSPWCLLTTPRAPSQRSSHSPQCPLTTLPSQPLMSPRPPSPLCLPPRPQQPPLLHTSEPLLPVPF